MFSFVGIRAKTQRLQSGFNNNCHHRTAFGGNNNDPKLSFSLSSSREWFTSRTKGEKEKELGIEVVVGSVLCPDYLVLMNHFALGVKPMLLKNKQVKLEALVYYLAD